MHKQLFAAALLAPLALSASPLTVSASDIAAMHPTIRATAPGAKVGAGYVTIHNKGASDDRLIAVEAPFSTRTELHEMKMVDQVMKMAPLSDGIAAPAGAAINLAPGGNHIMFMGLEGPLKEGEERKATLVFEKAGRMELIFKVKSIADTMKLKHSHMQKKADKHDH